MAARHSDSQVARGAAQQTERRKKHGAPTNERQQRSNARYGASRRRAAATLRQGLIQRSFQRSACSRGAAARVEIADRVRRETTAGSAPVFEGQRVTAAGWDHRELPAHAANALWARAQPRFPCSLRQRKLSYAALKRDAQRADVVKTPCFRQGRHAGINGAVLSGCHQATTEGSRATKQVLCVTRLLPQIAADARFTSKRAEDVHPALMRASSRSRRLWRTGARAWWAARAKASPRRLTPRLIRHARTANGRRPAKCRGGRQPRVAAIGRAGKVLRRAKAGVVIIRGSHRMRPGPDDERRTLRPGGFDPAWVFAVQPSTSISSSSGAAARR